MDIWIIIAVLLILAIVFLVLAFRSDDDSLDELLDISDYHTDEINQLKARVAELEQINKEADLANLTPSTEDITINVDEVDEPVKDEIIQMYSQGFTLNEISHHVNLDSNVVHQIIDNYIESR